MIDQHLRPVKEKVMTSMAQPLDFIHPNALTLIGFSLAMTSVFQLYYSNYFIGLLFWFGYMVIDGVDGTVARMHNKQTDFGGFLDKNLDAVVFTAVPLMIGYVMMDSWLWLCIAAMLGFFYINIGMLFMLSAVMEKRQVGKKEMTTVKMPTGIVEGFESYLFYYLFFIAPQFIHELVLIFTLLMLLTVIHRFWWAWRVL